MQMQPQQIQPKQPPQQAHSRLYRSRTDSMLGGVCGGLGRYLGIDPTVIRLFFVLLVLAGFGTGFLIYLAFWLVVPAEGHQGAATEDTIRAGANEIAQRAQTLSTRPADQQAGIIVGGALVLVGLIFLLQNVLGPWLPWLGLGTLWPLILIGIALTLFVRRTGGG